MRHFSVGVCLLVLLSGCARMPPATIGQTAGTIAGAVIVPGLGAPIGGLVGLLLGTLVQGHVDKGVERKERVTLGDQLGDRPSSIAAGAALGPVGEPVRVWVDESIAGGQLVAGHFDVVPVP